MEAKFQKKMQEQTDQLAAAFNSKMKELEDKNMSMQIKNESMEQIIEGMRKSKEISDTPLNAAGEAEIPKGKGEKREEVHRFIDPSTPVRTFDVYSQSDAGREDTGQRNQEHEGNERDSKSVMRGFDYKNQIKPEPYDGSQQAFHGWNELFTSLLTALDDKYEIVVDAMVKQKRTINEEDIKKIMEHEGLGDHIAKVNRTMYISLLQYTKGDAHAKVVSNGLKLSLDSYRYLYEKGKNETTRNCMHVMTRVMQPQ